MLRGGGGGIWGPAKPQPTDPSPHIRKISSKEKQHFVKGPKIRGRFEVHNRLWDADVEAGPDLAMHKVVQQQRSEQKALQSYTHTHTHNLLPLGRTTIKQWPAPPPPQKTNTNIHPEVPSGILLQPLWRNQPPSPIHDCSWVAGCALRFPPLPSPNLVLGPAAAGHPAASMAFLRHCRNPLSALMPAF